MNKWRQIIGLSAALIVFLSPLAVFAQAQNLNQGAAGIQVTPVIDEFDINPGGVVERQITIDNLTRNATTYYPVVMNFEADKETGEPVFIGENERFTKYALSNWVTFSESSFILAPGERKKISYVVNAPGDATPGGHYGAILFSTEKPEFDENGVFVGVVGLIGTLALATVPGDIIENLLVNSFKSPTIVFAPPASFETTIGNYGNVHVRPEGGITIRNWFGKQSTYLIVNESKGAVLPESQRLFKNNWDFSWLAIGRYTANLSLSYGDGKSVAELRTFYIIPYWFIVLVGALIAMFIANKLRRGRHQKTKENISPPRPPRRIVMG
ncbi:MAG: hypothetical protein WEC81_00740 [Patescibacteria group bacterium]